MLNPLVLILIPLAPSIPFVNATSGLACTSTSNALSRPARTALYPISPRHVHPTSFMASHFTHLCVLNFDGSKHYLIAACGMTAFGICRPTVEQTTEAFAADLIKIWLRFGFSHTIVVDKASAFLGVFSNQLEKKNNKVASDCHGSYAVSLVTAILFRTMQPLLDWGSAAQDCRNLNFN